MCVCVFGGRLFCTNVSLNTELKSKEWVFFVWVLCEYKRGIWDWSPAIIFAVFSIYWIPSPYFPFRLPSCFYRKRQRDKLSQPGLLYCEWIFFPISWHVFSESLYKVFSILQVCFSTTSDFRTPPEMLLRMDLYRKNSKYDGNPINTHHYPQKWIL